MTLKLKGLEVRDEYLGENYEVKFEDLTEKGQAAMFLADKNAFLFEALASKFGSVSLIAGENLNECSSKALNDAIIAVIEEWPKHVYHQRQKYLEILLKLLKSPNLSLGETLRFKLSCLNCDEVRLWVAEDSKTSREILRGMFISEVKSSWKSNNTVILNAVIKNPNFKFDTKLLVLCKSINLFNIE